jgi:hypothetical protein
MSKKILSIIFISLMLSLFLSYTVQAGYTGKEEGLIYFDDEGGYQDGYNLFSSLASTTVYLTDTMGRVINSWEDTVTTGLAVYLDEDGNLLRTCKSTDPGRFNAGGAGGRVKIVSWDGQVLWDYTYSSAQHRQHHDIAELPNGNILMVAWELKNEQECLNAGRYAADLPDDELWPDTIIEVNPNTSQIVWEWHVWDHMSCDRPGTWYANGNLVSSDTTDSGKFDINFYPDTSADWNHINTVSYNADLDQIAISSRTWDEIYVIDHDTTTQEAAGSAGDPIYRWGNPLAYQTGTSANHKLFGQHNIQWIPNGYPGAGNFLCYNNGNGRPGGNYSSADEWVPPLSGGSYQKAGNGTYLPADLTWTYDDSGSFYSAFISGVQRQPNGNTLICIGISGDIIEITYEDELVWEYINPIPAGASTFRFERYPPGFDGFDGKDMTPGDCIEGGCSYCGDGTCDDDEDENTCPEDCGGSVEHYEGDYTLNQTTTYGNPYFVLTSMSIDSDGDVTAYGTKGASGTGTVDENGNLEFEIYWVNYEGTIDEDWEVNGIFDHDFGWISGYFTGYCTNCE